jgi:hypothetical protein
LFGDVLNAHEFINVIVYIFNAKDD